ncbi:unnamed protein product [Diabrotica balteata]|uniref:TIL domain-containing protein n=1 Tax=Diabrotica balteata TaxID=107213 RepID=A0A9N9X6J7_DIABA|nr:unnamed protein product [Diabrotica balteata]
MKIIFALLILVFTDTTKSLVKRSEPEKCGPNETFTICGSACSEKNCEDVHSTSFERICLQACSVGCFCNQGYFRNTSSGKCVERC